MTQTSMLFCLVTLLTCGCANTSQAVRRQLNDKQLLGQWKAKGQADGWMDISCEGRIQVRTPEAEIQDGVISQIDERHFVPSPNPYGSQFTYKFIRNKVSGETYPVVMVRPVPDSNILKVMQAVSTIMGKDDTIVFRKVEGYSCTQPL